MEKILRLLTIRCIFIVTIFIHRRYSCRERYMPSISLFVHVACNVYGTLVDV